MSQVARACFESGVFQEREGDAVSAFQNYYRAVLLEKSNRAYWEGFAHAARFLEFGESDDQLLHIFLEAFKQKIPLQSLAIPAFSILQKQPPFILRDWTALSRNPLFLHLLRNCIVPRPLFEEVVTALRRDLSEKDHPEGFEEVLTALAIHCHRTEYVYEESEEERKRLLKMGNLPHHQALCAAYRPLEAPIGDPRFSAIDEAQYEHPLQEEELRGTIPRLHEVEEEVSLKVRQQYEENPYPRWETPVCHQIHPPFPGVESILIAGCGTGQHAVNTALEYPESEILAVDLSLASLAYGKRKGEECGVSNIDWLQGDILGLPRLNREFDLIECVGVLHHMENPSKGWEVLAEQLKPGGYFNVGLYSELGRRDIVEVRKRKRPFSLVNLKALRKELREERSSLSQSVDFYSVSGCRDLLFHAHEVRFTLPEIRELMDQSGMQFVRFEFSDYGVLREYKRMFPDDPEGVNLENWDVFEKENPWVFTGMYQFWLKKISVHRVGDKIQRH